MAGWKNRPAAIQSYEGGSLQCPDDCNGIRRTVAIEPSWHRSMGKLMALSLVCTMAAAVLFQPVLMGPPRKKAA
jgi:hypothetical protein